MAEGLSNLAPTHERWNKKRKERAEKVGCETTKPQSSKNPL